MFIIRKVDKQDVVYSFNRILLSIEKKNITDTCVKKKTKLYLSTCEYLIGFIRWLMNWAASHVATRRELQGVGTSWERDKKVKKLDYFSKVTFPQERSYQAVYFTREFQADLFKILLWGEAETAIWLGTRSWDLAKVTPFWVCCLFLTHATIWMNLNNKILSERNQT